MTVRSHSLNLGSELVNTVSYKEEGSAAIVFFKDIHDCLTGAAVGTVIPGESHHRLCDIHITSV